MSIDKSKLIELIQMLKKRKLRGSVHDYEDFVGFLDDMGPEFRQNKNEAYLWAQKNWQQNQELLDEESRILRLDRIERNRYLFYRLATAIGIAAVVLCTGWLAQALEIPLPLLRIAT